MEFYSPLLLDTTEYLFKVNSKLTKSTLIIWCFINNFEQLYVHMKNSLPSFVPVWKLDDKKKSTDFFQVTLLLTLDKFVAVI